MNKGYLFILFLFKLLILQQTMACVIRQSHSLTMEEYDECGGLAGQVYVPCSKCEPEPYSDISPTMEEVRRLTVMESYCAICRPWVFSEHLQMLPTPTEYSGQVYVPCSKCEPEPYSDISPTMEEVRRLTVMESYCAICRPWVFSEHLQMLPTPTEYSGGMMIKGRSIVAFLLIVVFFMFLHGYPRHHRRSTAVFPRQFSDYPFMAEQNTWFIHDWLATVYETPIAGPPIYLINESSLHTIRAGIALKNS